MLSANKNETTDVDVELAKTDAKVKSSFSFYDPTLGTSCKTMRFMLAQRTLRIPKKLQTLTFAHGSRHVARQTSF